MNILLTIAIVALLVFAAQYLGYRIGSRKTDYVAEYRRKNKGWIEL